MPRLTDADALKAYIEDYACVVCKKYELDKGGVRCGFCNYGFCLDAIDRHIKREAEPVVRCKDCRFYNTHDRRCVRMNHGFKDDFFCSWGERREDAKTD